MATTSPTPGQHSRKKRLLLFLIVCSFCLIAFLVIAEIGLRKKGIRPWTTRQSDFVKIEPPGRIHDPHPTLGYINKPGEYRITLPGSYSFKTTYLTNGLRITHPLNTYPGKGKKEILILGCSFTQGWTLNDEETYPWLLQEKLPDYEIVNFGVDGYSTAQSLIQLREALAKGARPALVVLSYGSFHDQRNTLTRTWMKVRLMAGAGQAYGHVNLPYARLSKDNRPEVLYQPFEYRAVPLLRYSALANFLDDLYNKSLDQSYHSLEVTRALIGEISSLCKANGIEFVLAGIFSDLATQAMLEHFNKQGVETVDISVDLSRQENTNLPYDGHPSAIANKEYARRLHVFISQVLSEQLRR